MFSGLRGAGFMFAMKLCDFLQLMNIGRSIESKIRIYLFQLTKLKIALPKGELKLLGLNVQ